VLHQQLCDDDDDDDNNNNNNNNFTTRQVFGGTAMRNMTNGSKYTTLYVVLQQKTELVSC
jgi:hypothetical protein